MNAPLATLQVSLESSGGASAAGNNSSYKQEDVDLSGGFAPLLDQAHATLPSPAAGSTAAQVNVESLTLQLQSLPQGGKLLPLLQKVLDGAESSGADIQQLVDQIAARLEQLQSGSELNPADDIAAVLQQLLANVPASQTVAAPQAVLVTGADGKTLKSASAAADPTGRSLTPLLDSRPAMTEMSDKPLPAEVLSNAKNNSLDKALAQFQQQGPEPRQTELASLMAAFKRHDTNSLKSADTLLRTEAATSAVTTPAAVQSSPSAPSSGLPTLTLGTPLNQGAWDQALGERIQWMVSHKLQGAQIKLNPANLGPMEVRIQVQNEQASIQFASAHGVVREALEAALPRLRDMFDAAGVELVDVDVSGQSFAEQQRTAGEGESAVWGGAVAEQDAGLETVLDTPLDRFLESGRLDLFA
jgi:flagellar hook-length control protein FliK